MVGREFICAQGSNGLNCSMQRALGEDNFNIMIVSSVLGFVPHIANDSQEKWGNDRIF